MSRRLGRSRGITQWRERVDGALRVDEAGGKGTSGAQVRWKGRRRSEAARVTIDEVKVLRH